MQGRDTKYRCIAGAGTAIADTAVLRLEFEREYTRLFARHIPNAEIEVMSWVVLATTAATSPTRLAALRRHILAPAMGERSILDARLGRRLAVCVYDRQQLAAGAAVKGPALIVEDGTATYVSPSFDAIVDGGGALLLTARASVN